MLSIQKHTILFPINFSEDLFKTLTSVINFCKIAQYELILLNIIESKLYDQIPDNEIETIKKDLTDNSNLKLENLKQELHTKHDFEITHTTYFGKYDEAIVTVSNDLAIKTIIIESKTSEDLFFTKSTYNIVKNALVPLLTIKSDNNLNNIKNILFPFNENIITLKKVDEVINLAKICNAKIHLLGVTDGITIDKTNVITNQMMHIKSLFDNEKINSEVHFYASYNYPQAILKFCTLNDVDLITVANNHQNSLIAESYLENINTVINKAKIPVLTVPVWPNT